MLPRIILHTEMSVDGRIDWFTPDIGQFYELASRWEEDATLAGNSTIFNPDNELTEDDEELLSPPERSPDDRRPLLVVPDSRGRVRNWNTLRESPYWRDMIALCSNSTPDSYLDYLRKRYIEYIIAGDDHVDLRLALEKINDRYGVKIVRVDSGGTLNGVLLRAGLVSEISVLIDPCMVGGTTQRSVFRAPDLTSSDGVIQLRLIDIEKLPNDVIWVRYEVTR